MKPQNERREYRQIPIKLRILYTQILQFPLTIKSEFPQFSEISLLLSKVIIKDLLVSVLQILLNINSHHLPLHLAL